MEDKSGLDALRKLGARSVPVVSRGDKYVFAQVIKDMQEGFFADPLYGGNRDMAGWKMIGYPGARYNYLDWVERHNERFPLPPMSLTGRADWSPKT